MSCGATKTTCMACDVFETEWRKEGAQGQERKTELWICVKLGAQAKEQEEEEHCCCAAAVPPPLLILVSRFYD